LHALAFGAVFRNRLDALAQLGHSGVFFVQLALNDLAAVDVALRLRLLGDAPRAVASCRFSGQAHLAHGFAWRFT
jgi:hypothetical protein